MIRTGLIMFTVSFVKTCLDRGLTERELMVVIDRSRGVTLAHIARDEGVTPERIRQIEAKALRKMKKIIPYTL
jgi:DNA-directed RNA polymerase sigma subunit (sigma70/sigma32)